MTKASLRPEEFQVLDVQQKELQRDRHPETSGYSQRKAFHVLQKAFIIIIPHLFLSVPKNQLIDKKYSISKERRSNKQTRVAATRKSQSSRSIAFFLVFQHLASCLSTIDPHKKASFLHFIGPVVQCCRSPKMHTIPISIKREKTPFLCSFSSFGTKAGKKMQVFMAYKK